MADTWMDDNIIIYEQCHSLYDSNDTEYQNKGHKQNVEAEIVAAMEKSHTYVDRPNSPLTCPCRPILPVASALSVLRALVLY